MERPAWTDERLDERMTAIDQTAERIFAEFERVREDMRAGFAEQTSELAALRSDFAALQDRLVQIGFGLVGILIAALVTLAIALA